jgi:hypothetical protein
MHNATAVLGNDFAETVVEALRQRFGNAVRV